MKIDATKIKTVLPATHISAETAYLVNDYPYGFRLRCKMRYWLEHHPKRGTRLVTQTSNPKVAGEVWNKPKASTYSDLGGFMFLDDAGHVQWHGLTFYADAEECRAFLAAGQAGMPEEVLSKLNKHIAAKLRYEQLKAEEMATGKDEWTSSRIAALVSAGMPLELARSRVSAPTAPATAPATT